MHMCMSICVSSCLCVCICVQECMSMCEHACARMYTCMHNHTDPHACKRVCKHTCSLVSTYGCMHVHSPHPHTHAHACTPFPLMQEGSITHTYEHTQTYMNHRHDPQNTHEQKISPHKLGIPGGTGTSGCSYQSRFQGRELLVCLSFMGLQERTSCSSWKFRYNLSLTAPGRVLPSPAFSFCSSWSSRPHRCDWQVRQEVSPYPPEWNSR